MAENIQPAHRGRLIAYAVLAIAVVGAGIVGITQLASYGESTSSSGSAVTPTDAATPQEDNVDKLTPGIGNKLLPEAMNGQDAIDSLGDNITVAAKRNNMTVEELTGLLLRDETAHVTTNGSLLYIDSDHKRD
ncbi:MAG: hypothetical protein ACOH19_12625 [Rhodoglobus sp.]